MDEAQDTSSSHLRAPEERARLQQRSDANSRRSIQDIEELVTSLYEKFAVTSDFSDEEGNESTQGKRYIQASDLPKVLIEFEQTKGQAIILPESLTYIQTFASANPSVQLSEDNLVKLIMTLDSAANNTEAELTENLQEVISDATTGSSSEDDDSSVDHSGEEDHPKKTLPRQRSSGFRFPSSTSKEGLDQGRKTPEPFERSSTPKRGFTTSDPASPLKGRGGSAPPQDTSKKGGRKSGERRISTEERNSNGIQEEKEILRGKGKLKAPPTAWSRKAAPPAISAGRARRQSSTDVNGNEGGSAFGSGRSASFGFGESSSRGPRQRNTSQPTSVTGFGNESDGDDSMTSPPQFPRSVSTGSAGFQYPRATSPNAYREDNEREDAWDRVIPNQGSSSRGASPSLDGDSTYQGFGSLGSPSHILRSNQHQDSNSEANEIIESLKSKVYELENKLSSSKKDSESQNEYFESQMAIIQNENEASKKNLESKRKELADFKNENLDLGYNLTEVKDKTKKLEAEEKKTKELVDSQKANIEQLTGE